MRNKLRIGFLLIIALLWAIGVYWVLSSMELRDISLHVQNQVFPTIIEMGQMNTQLNEVRELTLAYILLGDYSDEREASREQLEELYQSVRQFAAKHSTHANIVGPEARKDAEELTSLSEGLVLASAEVVSLKDEGVEYRQLSEKMETDFEPIFWSLKGLLDELTEKHEEEFLAAQAIVANQSNTNITLTLVFTIIATLAAMMVAIIVDRLFLRYLTERKELEDALRLRAEEWDRITNSVEDFISVQDRDFRFTRVNESLARALKTKREDLIGKRCHEVLHKSDVPWPSCPLADVFEDGETHTTEVEDPNLGATFLVTASPVFDEKGEIIAGVHIAKDVTDKKRYERALQESQAKWRSIARNSPDIIMLVGTDNNILFINRTIAGLKRNEVIGTCVYDYIPDGYKSRVKECHECVLKTGNPGQYETDYQTSEGEVMHFEARVGAVRQSGNIVGITVSTRDITQRKKSEDALRESEKKYRTLSSNIPGMVYRGKADWSTEIISNSEIVCGYSIDEFNTQKVNWLDLIHPDDKEQVLEEGSKLREKPIPVVQEYRILAKDGSTRWVDDHKVSIFKEDGSFIGIDGIVYDVTQRKRMEIELRIKEEAIASSVNAIILADLKGNLNYVNRSFLYMWGYSDEKEVLGKPVAELWNTKEGASEALEAVQSNKSWVGELVARRKDDSVFDVQLLASIVENEAGKAICMMASVIDITERKKIEQMKSDFVALASHELRTPLTSIQGYTELILDGDVGEISREQREFLEIISQNTRRLGALIDDVLDVEKIESGRMTMKMEKTDLSQIVDSCVKTFKVMAEGKGFQLEKDVKTSPINVLGDSDRLSQVFSNLLSNAIKYTKEGRVTITADIKGQSVSVVVEDTGLGMSPEDMKIVFSRFFRAEDSYVRKTTGSGLGLSIAKATIERHDGDIKVESKLGAGSKFEVILPLFKGNEGTGQ